MAVQKAKKNRSVNYIRVSETAKIEFWQTWGSFGTRIRPDEFQWNLKSVKIDIWYAVHDTQSF